MDGWMDGWMFEDSITTVDPKLIRPDFVMITNVVIRIMRIKGQGDSDKDQRSKMCCKTPKIQEITVRYIIPVIY